MPSSETQFLRETFLRDVRVIEAAKGYLSVPSFTLRIEPKVLAAAAKAAAAHYKSDSIQVIHGVPHSGTYFATAMALALPQPVHLHASRKDHSVPVTWKEVLRREVRSFSASLGGVDTFAGLNFSFVRKGDKVLVVDDVCAKGETGSVIIQGLRERGVEVVGYAVLFDKVFQGGLDRIAKLGIKTYSCVRVKSIGANDRVELLD